VKGQYRKDRPYEFTGSAWITLWELEREAFVSVAISMLPSVQRGVFAFDITATALEDQAGAKPLARVYDTWPNAYEQPFEVWLFQCTFKLAQMARAAREDRGGPSRKRK
jgi:hypothetical protein